jgi:hypothetical protein
VVSLDPERTWFRFHQLFGDLLRLELRRTLPEGMPALHRLAAGWFARHGHVVEAIRHTQAAGDWHDAARLLADHAFSLALDGQARTVQVLLRAFPPGAGADPELALVRAGGELSRTPDGRPPIWRSSHAGTTPQIASAASAWQCIAAAVAGAAASPTRRRAGRFASQ